MTKNVCNHPHITEFITNHYASTMEEPAEDVGYGECDTCGERFEFETYPEESTVKQDCSLMDGSDGDEDIPDLPDYPELFGTMFYRLYPQERNIKCIIIWAASTPIRKNMKRIK